MNVLIDLNVLLAVIQERHPYYHASAATLSRSLNEDMVGIVPGHCVTTLYYIIARYTDKKRADEIIKWLMDHFRIAAIGRLELVRAQSLAMNDFEDGVVAAAAESVGCDLILTRNLADFKKSPVPAVTPDEFLVSY